MDSFITVNQISRGEYRDKGSKFMAFLYPASSESECREQLKALKKEYNKANHHCFAYRLQENEIYRLSDDGEPSGSAGRPIMGVIERHELFNVHMVVVRYFGGIKLGVRGLIDAYSAAAELAIQSAVLREQPIFEKLIVVLNYSALGFIERFVQQNKLTLLNADFEREVHQEIGVAPSRYKQIKRKLEEEIKEEFGNQIQTPYPIKIKPL